MPAWMLMLDFKLIADRLLLRYQKTGIRWLYELHTQLVGGILADEMGLGKTIQICVFFRSLAESQQESRIFRYGLELYVIYIHLIGRFIVSKDLVLLSSFAQLQLCTNGSVSFIAGFLFAVLQFFIPVELIMDRKRA